MYLVNGPYSAKLSARKISNGVVCLIYRRSLLFTLILILISACQRQNEVELTLVAQKLSLETQIAEIRQTATVDSERLQITVEYMGTLVSRAEQQRFELQATQLARDPNAANDASANQQFTTPFPTPGETVINNDNFTPTPEQSETITEVPGVPALQNIVMAASVGNDDCAAQVTSTFTTSTPEIYVVATAMSITPGTNIAARFSIGGQEIRHDFTPDFEINGNCVWFFIDQNDLEFRPGNWSVQLELNGTPASTPVAFTITEDA